MSVEVMVAQWLESAYQRGASDIHFEPVGDDDRLRVRMRVDGELSTIETVGDGRKVMARLKVMAGLDVNERAIPQDGRIRHSSTGGGRGQVDLRMSTTPCMGGEKCVLRVIDSSRLGKSLEDLGYSKKMLAAYKPIIESPYGLLLHVGPTGSGKTTSLYAVVTMLNRPEINIQTVEDPVEYNLIGVTQTGVNHDQGLTFPKVLRALLRQDPNVILLGEIRDAETAEIALEASMTGHLVLSTLHANDSVGAIIRLLDMGCTAYAIAYALRNVIAQRFVKRVCKRCKVEVQPPEQIVRLMGGARTLARGEGCKDCSRSGFDGRVALYEQLPMSEPLKKAVYKELTPEGLNAVALRNGMISMWQDGLEKAANHDTTIEEVLRVTKEIRARDAAAMQAIREQQREHAGAPAPRLGNPPGGAKLAVKGARPAPTGPAVRPAAARPAGPRTPKPPGGK